MKKRAKLGCLAVALAVIVVLLAAMYLRYRANIALGRELQKEVETWLASIPEIPEEENGAPVVTRGLKMLKPIPQPLTDLSIDSDSEAKQLRDYLAANRKALKVIGKGLEYKKWAFTTDYEKGYFATEPDLAGFFKTSNIYILKGNLAKRNGKESDALKAYINAFRLTGTLSGERSLTSKMMFYGQSWCGLQRLAKLLVDSTLSQESLSSALEVLLEINGRRIHPALVYELNYFQFIMFLSNYLSGKASGGPISFNKSGLGWKTDVGFFLTNSRFLYSFRRDVEIYRKYLEILRSADLAKYYEFPCALKKEGVLWRKIGLQINSWDAVWAQVCLIGGKEALTGFLQNEICFRGAITLTAIRLYQAKNGSLPENLEQLGELVPKEILVDPFSGNSLIYRVEGDDFYFYSVGYDGKDNKAKEGTPLTQEYTCIESMTDIIFHAPAMEKNMKTPDSDK